MSTAMPCFAQMPERTPISQTEVSQLPFWPTASENFSAARAGRIVTASTAGKAAASRVRRCMVISSLCVVAGIPTVAQLRQHCVEAGDEEHDEDEQRIHRRHVEEPV